MTPATLAHATSARHGSRSLVLWCPDWPVRAARAALAEHGLPETTPVAVLDRGLVYACSEAARAAGVRRGYRVREAQSRCPELVPVRHDPAVDRRAFEAVLDLVETTIPDIRPIRPGVCAAAVRGAARYHGGEEAVAALVIEQVAAHGIDDARVGIADAVFTAEQAARSADTQDWRVVPVADDARFLAPLPIGVIGEPDIEVLLRRLGIRTLADFAALAETDVRDRFGQAGVRAHRHARGLDPELPAPRTPLPVEEYAAAFDPPLRRVDQVTASSRPVAHQMVQDLAHRHEVCRSLWIEVHTDDGAFTDRQWSHPRWFDSEDLIDRLSWQLTETPASSPVTMVRLVADRVVPATDFADDLWGTGASGAVHQAAASVQGRLGRAAVGTLAFSGGHTPAHRQHFTAWGDASSPPRPVDRPWPGRIPPPTPGTVLDPPVPAQLLDRGGSPIVLTDRGALSAPPARVRPAAHSGLIPVEAWAGPWPTSPRWWAPPRDQSPAERALASRILGEPAAAATTLTRPPFQPAVRLQVVGVGGQAWLLLLIEGTWWTEARYD